MSPFVRFGLAHSVGPPQRRRLTPSPTPSKKKKFDGFVRYHFLRTRVRLRHFGFRTDDFDENGELTSVHHDKKQPDADG